MNRMILVFCALIPLQLAASDPLKIGDPLPDFEIRSTLNAPIPSISSHTLKNKVYILEFWATWCGACIGAMDHLNELQQEFPEQLQVIAISSESQSRIEKFIMNKPSAIWYGIDEGSKINDLFGVRIIPHTIVVDKAGRIAAITTPKAVTSEIIAQLLKNQKINLPIKKDNENIDYTIDYFNAHPNTTFSVDLRTYRQGYPTYSVSNDKDFGNRRFTAINFTMAGLYKIAFQKNKVRTEYKVEESMFSYKKENLYCFDIIVPEDRTEERFGIMQQYLNSILPVNGRIENKEKDVYILKKLPSFEENRILSSDTVAVYAFRGTQFEMKYSPMEAFRDYIENSSSLPVVDETGLERMYDITFSYSIENPKSFNEELKNLGLTIEKGRRLIDMLVIYQ